MPFLFARDGAALGGNDSAQPVVRARVAARGRPAMGRKRSGDIGDSPRTDPPPRGRHRAGYAYIYSMIAFDLVMSLAPRWHSTLFGAYFFTGAYWSAVVTMALVAVATGRGVSGEIEHRFRDALHDIGKLFFACSVFWVYLLFSQYIVDLVRRHSRRDFLRGAARSASTLGRIGLVRPDPDLGYSVLRADGQAAQAHARDPDHGWRARADRDVDRALRPGGAFAVATAHSLWLGRGADHLGISRRLRTDRAAGLATGAGARAGAARRRHGGAQ